MISDCNLQVSTSIGISLELPQLSIILQYLCIVKPSADNWAVGTMTRLYVPQNTHSVGGLSYKYKMLFEIFCVQLYPNRITLNDTFCNYTENFEVSHISFCLQFLMIDALEIVANLGNRAKPTWFSCWLLDINFVSNGMTIFVLIISNAIGNFTIAAHF